MLLKWNRIGVLLFFVLACIYGWGAEGTETSTEPFAADPVQVSLVGESEMLQAGRPFHVALQMTVQKGWHIYWDNPGDAGLATLVDWVVPEGFTVNDVQWSYPKRFSSDMGVGYGFDDVAYVVAEIIPSDVVSSKSVDIKAQVTWMACGESCMPGQSSATLPMATTNDAPVTSGAWTSLLSQTQGSLIRRGHHIEVKHAPGSFALSFQSSKGEEVDTAYFFMKKGGVVDVHADQKLERQGDLYILTVVEDAANETPTETIEGVLVFSTKVSGSHAFEVTSKVQEIPTDAFVEAQSSVAHATTSDFAIAVCLAFLGGLLLNLMPCVLPVISFKVMSFVQMAKESRAAIIRHSLAFFTGVLLSFWTLAGVLLALRAYGQSVGWGFQLQEPLFVGLLSIILLVFGLSLFGVFELGTSVSAWAGKEESTSQKKFSGLTGSFFSGVLATAVATPCTGPFLGTTLGFAVTLPSSLAMIVFTAMATGMSLPYLVVAVVPSALRYFPKPGAWMVTFREVMGFVIMLTVLWLVWVFSALTGSLSVVLLLSSFLLAALASWVFGKWGHAAMSFAPRMVGILVAAVFMTLGLYDVVTAARCPSGDSASSGGMMGSAPENVAWETFSAEKLERCRREGIPVFVDFTAKWCLICQANKVVLHADSVAKKFSEKGVVRMLADWTKNDPIITAELKKFGRSGVPLYVLYGASDMQPQILPQVLTTEVVTSNLDQYIPEASSGRLHIVEESPARTHDVVK